MSWLFYLTLSGVGVCWIPAYALAIRYGLVDRLTAIPAFIVPLDLAWELVHSLVVSQWEPQRPINFGAAFLDFFIMWLVLRYGHKDYPEYSKRVFRLRIWAMFVASVILCLSLTYELGDNYGVYGAVLINIALSWGFIQMLEKRKSSAGQSMYIAILKFLGSFSSLWFFVFLFPHRYFLMLAAVCYGIIDVTYIVLLYRQFRCEGRNPWTLLRAPEVIGDYVPSPEPLANR